MLGIAEWARDLLLSRGALADIEDGDAVRAFLPQEVARTLGAQEWLSLRFGAGPGADDAGEWIERLGALLPAGHIVPGGGSTPITWPTWPPAPVQRSRRTGSNPRARSVSAIAE